MPPKTGAEAKDPKLAAKADKAESSKEMKKDRNRILTQMVQDHGRNHDFVVLQQTENQTIKDIDKSIAFRDKENIEKNNLQLKKIRESKEKLKELKKEIASVEKSIMEAQEQHEKSKEQMINEFTIKKDAILKESKEVEDQLNHYAEWQRQSDSFKTHLSELKSTIHHNRVLCSEVIAENRQNAQAKIEKHRVDLAEAIRQARAESLRLRSGDISDLSTTFLTQSEQQVNSLNSQLESSEHLAEVNQTIEADNQSMAEEISKLQKKNEVLREQEEKQTKVLAKLAAIKAEFAEREEAERRRKQKAKEAAEREQKRIEEEAERNKPTPKPPYKMSSEDEAFLTFLNECATSVRSVLKQLLGDNSSAPVNPRDDKFEAPKLSAMVDEIKAMTAELDTRPVSKLNADKPVLTPAAAYFAFSAPFDDSDEFIKSENWSFAKYEACKPAPAARKPRIVRIKTGSKTPI